MNAGVLRQRVTLRDRGDQPDGRGGFTEVPTVVASRLPANVQPLAGGALVRAMQIDPRSRYQVTLRFMRGVTPRLELLYHDVEGDRVFEILNINDTDEIHRELVLLCAEAA